MDEWRTVWEHEVASYGKQSKRFSGPDGVYRVSVDDQDKRQVVVHHYGRELRWHIEVKEVRGRGFRLSGLTSGTENTWGDVFWYELELTSPSTIAYWGDRVLVRRDQEV